MVGAITVMGDVDVVEVPEQAARASVARRNRVFIEVSFLRVCGGGYEASTGAPGSALAGHWLGGLSGLHGRVDDGLLHGLDHDRG